MLVAQSSSLMLNFCWKFSTLSCKNKKAGLQLLRESTAQEIRQACTENFMLIPCYPLLYLHAYSFSVWNSPVLLHDSNMANKQLAVKQHETGCVCKKDRGKIRQVKALPKLFGPLRCLPKVSKSCLQSDTLSSCLWGHYHQGAYKNHTEYNVGFLYFSVISVLGLAGVPVYPFSLLPCIFCRC